MTTHSHAIDIHAHFYPDSYLRLMTDAGAPFDAGCDWSNPKGPRMWLGKHYRSIPLERKFIDIDARIEAMNECNVKVHVLSLTLPMVYWGGRDLSLKLCQAFNDSVVAAHDRFPDRFFGFAILPLHQPDLAIQEFDRIAKFPCFRGVYAATTILDKELSDPLFFPVYERLEAMRLPLFLHPLWVIGEERLERHRLHNALGNPFDSAVAASFLILDGTLDRFPGLDICLPHAGGVALMSVIGRVNHCWTTQPELVKARPHEPRDYLRRFHYDTIAHSDSLLRFLIDEVGADRVMLGSDYCYAMGYERPVEVVTQHPRISDAERGMILHGNAERLLRLDQPHS